MKTFNEKFRDLIDLTNGQVIINETVYKSIQRDTLEHAEQICLEGESVLRDMFPKFKTEVGAKACADNIKNAYKDL